MDTQTVPHPHNVTWHWKDGIHTHTPYGWLVKMLRLSERNQSQKMTGYMTPCAGYVLNSKCEEKRVAVMAMGWQWLRLVNWNIGVSFLELRKMPSLKLVVTILHVSEYIKNCWVLHLKWVNCRVFEEFLRKVEFKHLLMSI